MTRKGILMIAALFLVAFVVLGLGRLGYEEIEGYQSLEKAAEKIRKDFPRVKPIAPGALADLLENPGPVLLIDAREPLEYAVSLLPGAVNLRTVNEVNEHLAARKEQPEIRILYGAIGFRAAELADELLTSGRGNLELLEGGIFRWANEGLSLVDPQGRTVTQVHSYNKVYRRLLDPAKRALTPEAGD